MGLCAPVTVTPVIWIDKSMSARNLLANKKEFSQTSGYLGWLDPRIQEPIRTDLILCGLANLKQPEKFI